MQRAAILRSFVARRRFRFQRALGWILRVTAFACAALLLPALLLPAPVFAQNQARGAAEPPLVQALPVLENNPYENGNARSLFDSGVAATRDGDWVGAESQFRQSLRLTPRRSTTYNLARVLYELGRPSECLRMLNTLETLPPAPNADEYAQHAARLRDKAELAVGYLQLTLTPALASVVIDEQPQSEVGAVRRLALDPGTHQLRITAQGYLPYSTSIGIRRGETFELAPELLPQSRPAAAPGPGSVVAPAARTPSPGTPAAGTQSPGTQSPGTQAPGTQSPGTQAPGTQSPGIQAFGHWPAYVAFGVAGSLALGGLGFGLAANQADTEFEGQCPSLMGCSAGLAATQRRAERYALTADVLYVSSVVVAGVGLGLWWWGNDEASGRGPRARLQLWVSPAMTGAVVSHVY